MFCPSCGFEYTQKTNYCKRCGGDLSHAGVTNAPKKTQPDVAGFMFLGVSAFCLFAMILILSAYGLFSREGLNGDEAIILTFVAIFLSVVSLMLIWQLARMVTASRLTGQEKIVEKHFIREVPSIQPVATTGQIPETAGPPSVVEHTTRQMAGVYSEPKAME